MRSSLSLLHAQQALARSTRALSTACARLPTIRNAAETGKHHLCTYTAPDAVRRLRELHEKVKVMHDESRHEEARSLSSEAYELARGEFGDAHPATASAANNLALMHKGCGDTDAAATLYRTALDSYRDSVGEGHASTAAASYNLAVLLRSKGEYKEAEALDRAALATRETACGAVCLPPQSDVALARSVRRRAGLGACAGASGYPSVTEQPGDDALPTGPPRGGRATDAQGTRSARACARRDPSTHHGGRAQPLRRPREPRPKRGSLSFAPCLLIEAGVDSKHKQAFAPLSYRCVRIL